MLYPTDEATYRKRFAAWKRADPEQRVIRHTRDDRGRRCIDYVSYGVTRCRIVDVGGGWGEVYADRSPPHKPVYGPISFKTWDDPKLVFGVGRNKRQ